MQTPYDKLVAQLADTPLTRLTRQTIEAQQNRFAALSGSTAAETAAEQLVQAQRDRFAALSGSTAAETAAEQLVRAQQGQFAALSGSTAAETAAQQLVRAQQGQFAALSGSTAAETAAQRFAVDALGPLTRRLAYANQDRVDEIAQRIGTLQLRIFDGVDVSEFAGVLDRDDAVDQLVASPRLRATVRSFVESEEVQDLVGQLNTADLSEADADEVAEHTTSVVAKNYPGDDLTAGQIVTIFSAIDLLVIAAVAAAYGYDVGVVADVLAWPLAALGLYGFVSYLHDNRQDG